MAEDSTATGDGTLPCRLCGERYDPSEMYDYGGVLLCDGCADTDSDQLAATIVRLRDALAFYADPANWEPFDFYWIGDAEEAGPRAVSDLGERARDALAEAKEGNRG